MDASPASEIASYRLQDLAPGQTHHFEVALTVGLIDRFSACSGDVSPIHTSRQEASARGFTGRVAHGMLLGALLSRMVGCHLPGRHALLLNADFHFHKPCFEGEVVRVEGTVESLSPATRSATMNFRFTVGGALRARAIALVGLSA